MKEGDTDQFRVRAVNDEGPGEPTKPTPPITAADQPEAPRICTPDECIPALGNGVGGLNDVKIKVMIHLNKLLTPFIYLLSAM